MIKIILGAIATAVVEAVIGEVLDIVEVAEVVEDIIEKTETA